MRKGRLLNSEIISVLSRLGHTDQITIADAGLPIKDHVKRVDLALLKGIPTFLETVKAIHVDMEIEKIILAAEIKTQNEEVYKALILEFPNVEIEYVTHETFKQMTQESKAVIRTGECTPYANIILQSGVNFSGE